METMDATFGKGKDNALVLYTTKHGHTRRFAERIAQQLDAQAMDACRANAEVAKTYDAVVLGCCVYAGQIKGLRFFARHAKALADKRLVLFTCGLYDPAQPEVREALDAQIASALGDAAASVSVFHLHGGLCWESLGFAERLMLRALLSGIRKKKPGERTAVERQMLEAEGGQLDFSGDMDLSGIVCAAKRCGEETA